MKNLILILLSIIFSSAILLAQTVTETKTLYPSETAIEKEGTNYNYGVYNIGKRYSGGYSYIYRTYYTVSLSQIPSTSTINWVKVYYFSDSKAYSFKLTNLASVTGTLGSDWAAIGNASSFQSGIGYGSSNFTSTSIKNQMQSSLSGGSMYIGALGEDETSNDSYTSLSIYLEVNYTRPAESLDFYVQNYMDGYTGGNIGVGENTPTISSQSSPYYFSLNETQYMYFQAYDDQSANGYNYVFNDSEAPLEKSSWRKHQSGDYTLLGSSSSMSREAVKTEDGATFQAVLKKECLVTIRNNFIGVGNGGVINVNGVQVSSPSSGNIVVEDNAITGGAVNQTINGIYYTLNNWSNSSTSYNTTFYPGVTATYTANYVGVPSNNYRHLTTNSTPGQYVILDWDEHPNTNVTKYYIYRKVRSGGVTGEEHYLGYVNRGTTTYTDTDYQIADGWSNQQLLYDVRAYYSTEDTYAPEDYITTVYAWNEQNIKNADESADAEIETEEPPVVEENKSEIALGNFPNPFNPTTNISYSLADDGFVSLKVYNVLGKEIATLVNETKPAGNYSVSFNASNLPSGVYIYTLQTSGQSLTRKMLLMK